jgi:DNA-binding transcriptional ArsR family regulator
MKAQFELEFLEQVTETLRAIAHPIRIAIVDLLKKNEQLSVTEIYEQLNIEQAVASHHLRILKDKKVVTVQREQKFSLYSLRNPRFYEIIDIMKDVL